MPSATSAERPKWARRVSAVLIALTQSRYALRRAAQRSGDRRVAMRLRRLARRRRAAVAELERLNPPPGPDSDAVAAAESLFTTEIRAATEIGSVTACLRANRKLRSSIENALAAAPPPRVAQRLELLRDQADRDAADLNVRLRELVTLPVSSAGAPHLGDHVAPRAPE